MYGASSKAIIELYYKGNTTDHQRLSQLEQWRSDVLLAHEYARQKMKEKIKSIFTPFKKGDKVWLEGTNLKFNWVTTKRSQQNARDPSSS